MQQEKTVRLVRVKCARDGCEQVVRVPSERLGLPVPPPKFCPMHEPEARE